MARTVVCGIGNKLRGDDGIGPMVIEELQRKKSPENTLLIDCGSAPENFSKNVIEFSPDKIIIVDAVEMKRKPGEIAEIPLDKVKQSMATTHKMPITIFIEYLQRSLPETKIIFLGVQQKNVGFGEEMTEECKRASTQLSQQLSSDLA